MKRSAHVALVVMATTGVGASAYALMPSENCGQTPPGVAQSESCRSSHGGYGHAGGWWGSRGSSFFSSPSGSESGSSATAFSGATERGGFGGTAHGMGGGHGAGGS
jgi:hypothetical protein